MNAQNAYEHRHRYALAARVARRADVLEIGCGDGRGAFQIASTARSMIGIDLDEASIAQARTRFVSQNLSFVVGSGTSIPLDADSVDLILSFETLGFFAEPRDRMAEIIRVLRPHGLLMISVPNNFALRDRPESEQFFRDRELYFAQFHKLLAEYFPTSAIYGQRLIEASEIHGLDGQSESVVINAEDSRNDGSSTLNHDRFLIGFCSLDASTPLKNIASLYFGPSDDPVEASPETENDGALETSITDGAYQEIRRAYARAIARLADPAENSPSSQVITALCFDLESHGIPARPVAEAFEELVNERDRLERELAIAGEQAERELLESKLAEAEREREAIRRRLEEVERSADDFRLDQQKLLESNRLVAAERESRMREVSDAFEGLRTERQTLLERTARLEIELEEFREISRRQAVQITMLERVRARLHDGTKRAMTERVALREDVRSIRLELSRARARVEELEAMPAIGEDAASRADLSEALEQLVALKREHDRACQLLHESMGALDRSHGVALDLAKALAILQGRLTDLEQTLPRSDEALSAQFARTLDLRERRVRMLEDLLGRIVREVTSSVRAETRSIETASGRILGSKIFRFRAFLLERAKSFKSSKSATSSDVDTTKSKRDKTRVRHLHSA